MSKTLKFVLIFLLLVIFQYGYSMSEPDTSEEPMTNRKTSLGAFPILMYDSDIGFGFGGKGIIKNLLKKNESLDLILFASTKGEQWYVLTFSMPDFEIRQGTAFPWAFDLKLEYDKILKSNFFGFGNDSEDNDWQFPRRMAKLELSLSRGFTESIIGEAGFVLNNTRVYDYDSNLVMTPDVPGIGENTTTYLSAGVRWDTRDSQNHPHQGWNLCFNSDFSSESFSSAFSYQRYRLEVNKYQQLFTPAHILAARIWAQHVEGTAPYYEQSIIGGTWTTRGFKADRFIDQAMTLASIEYRVVFYKQIGAVLFVDAGRVYPSIEEISLQDWHANWGAGLRYVLKDFVVRFDAGHSSEGTRIFFNFGHVF